MRVNLGCGKQPLPGYCNVDALDLPGVDIVGDAVTVLAAMPDASVDEIFSQHMIEHLLPAQWFALLVHIVRVLKPGGVVILECPDIKRVCECFVADTGGLRWSWWHHCLYGDPSNGGAHRQGFTIQRLRDELEAAGLHVARSVPWGDNNPEGGCNVKYNLRVEAVKP